jgi:hypothetical protein
MAPPKTRRRFDDSWDEIEYCLEKFLYWYDHQGDRVNAQPFAVRLKGLLNRVEAPEAAILGRECLSLLAEFDGRLEAAIRHRRAEVALIDRLWAISLDSPQQRFVLSTCGPSILSDRLELLASLIAEAGDLDEAIRLLERSAQLCAEHKVTFHGEELLDDLREDRSRNAESSRRARKPSGKSINNRA